MASKLISKDKSIFKFCNKVTNIVSTDVILKPLSYTFWILDYFWWVRSLLKSLFVKIKVSTRHKTKNCLGMKGQKKPHHIFLWKCLEVLVELFFEVPRSGCGRGSSAKQNRFKFDGNKALELFQLILLKRLCNKSVTEWTFSKGSGLTMNGSNQVEDRFCGGSLRLWRPLLKMTVTESATKPVFSKDSRLFCITAAMESGFSNA